MKLATTTADFDSCTSGQAEAIECIAKSGFRYVDYNFHSDYLRRDGVYGDGFCQYVEDIRKKADDLGVKLVQAHSPMGPVLEDNNEDFIADTIKCIEACGSWGVENLVVHSGYARNLTREETILKNKEFYMQLLPIAEKYGVNILTENFNKMCVDGLFWIDNASDLLALVEAVDHPLFHAVWDTGHGNMQDGDQDEYLAILGKHVYALHVQDNPGDWDAHVPPYFGTMNVDSLMQGLTRIGYKGYFTFECPNIFAPAKKRRPYDKDSRLLNVSMDLRIEAEKLLFQIGKHILTSYGCYED